MKGKKRIKQNLKLIEFHPLVCVCVLFFLFIFYFWPYPMAYGILVLWPGIKAGPLGCENTESQPPGTIRATREFLDFIHFRFWPPSPEQSISVIRPFPSFSFFSPTSPALAWSLLALQLTLQPLNLRTKNILSKVLTVYSKLLINETTLGFYHL